MKFTRSFTWWVFLLSAWNTLVPLWMCLSLWRFERVASSIASGMPADEFQKLARALAHFGESRADDTTVEKYICVVFFTQTDPDLTVSIRQGAVMDVAILGSMRERWRFVLAYGAIAVITICLWWATWVMRHRLNWQNPWIDLVNWVSLFLLLLIGGVNVLNAIAGVTH